MRIISVDRERSKPDREAPQGNRVTAVRLGFPFCHGRAWPYRLHTSAEQKSLAVCCGVRFGIIPQQKVIRNDASLGRFGDRRLQKGGAFLLARLLGLGQCGIGLRALGGDRAGEVRLDRFLKNPRVTPAEMVATARAHLPDQVQGREVLVIQDTTSLRDDGNKCGLHLHPAIAVGAADGALSGLLSADLPVRDEIPKTHCNKRRLNDKESRRWVDATVRTADLLTAGASRAMAIADREADLYEMFACRPEAVDVLVRANQTGRWPTVAGSARVATMSRNCGPRDGRTAACSRPCGARGTPCAARPAHRHRAAEAQSCTLGGGAGAQCRSDPGRGARNRPAGWRGRHVAGGGRGHCRRAHRQAPYP